MDFNTFSLIYPDEASRKLHDSGECVPDIDLFTLQELGLLEALTLKNGDLSSFFTTDPAVMKYRIATFDDMMRCEELTALLNRLVPVLNDIMELRRLEADSGDPNDYLSSITEIELYVSSVEILHSALTKVRDEVHSPAFTSLAGLVTELAESDYYRELNDLGRSPSLDSYNQALGYSEQYTLTATLTYAKVFAEKHDFKIMAGYEAKYGKFADLNATATDFPVDNPQSFELSTNASKLATGALSDDRFLSVFGRLNYSFDNRYLLTVNFRGDGSPKFSPKNRWGFFPSVSVGWKISEEPFFRNWDQTWLSLVKPRFSWGILGNDQALDKYAYMMSFQKLTEHSFDGTTAVGGYNNVKVINEDIKWESIYTTNVGLDLEFFNHRLLVSADYYKRITRNMIYDIAVPNSSGITTMPSYSAMSTMPVNIGRIDNEGWELQVAYRNNIGFFNYSVSANVSQNSNRVVDIGLPTAFIYGGGGWPNSGLSPCKTVNGMPISMLFGLKTDGLITSQEEIDELNAIAQANGHAYYHQRLTGVGDLKYVDLNGDGTINDEDRTFIGNPWPKVQYGFNISLEYRGIDLSADFVGIAGNDVMNLAKSFTQSVQHSSQTTSEIFNASFFLGNGLTDQPRVMAYDTANGNAPVKDPNLNYQLYSDYFIEDGSYLKLKTLTLGYTLPRRWTRKAGIQKLRVYVSGHNLLTFTKFTGLDPEFASSAKTATGIYYSSTYPQTRMISFGIDMTF